jgi:hypothetical protein
LLHLPNRHRKINNIFFLLSLWKVVRRTTALIDDKLKGEIKPLLNEVLCNNKKEKKIKEASFVK